MRRLPGPAYDRLGDGGDSRGSLRIVSGLAENTNSIFCDGSPEPEAANGCPVLREQEPPAERRERAAIDPDQIRNALSKARRTDSCFFVDKDWVENRVLQAGVPIGSTRYPSSLSFRIIFAVWRCWDSFDTAGPCSSYGTPLCRMIQIKWQRRFAITPIVLLCPKRETRRRYTISKMLPLRLTAAFAA